MVFPSLIKIAFEALVAHKLRSSLTLLGIMIGVTSVMTIISALEGMAQEIEDDLAALGPATFVVQRIAIVTSDEMFMEKIKRKPLIQEDIDLVRKSCTLCEKVSIRAWNRASVKYGSKTLRRMLVGGTTSNYIDIVDLEASQGRFYSNEDELYRRNVAYIGDLVREEFFEDLDPIGKEIKIGAYKYTVVGVNKKMGASFGQSRDNFILIPMSTYKKHFGTPRRGLSMVAKANSVPELPDAMDQTRMILRAARHVPYNEGDDFDMVTAETILEVLNSFTKIFRTGLVGVASISLVVGGIVVMNIMMVSVTERTREIGIRKSLGAKQSHLLLQFLFEALFLTLMGGIIGIVAGFFIAKSLVALIDFDISPSTLAIVAGLSISIGIGLIFGIYPAMKAAKLDPIKALSYE